MFTKTSLFLSACVSCAYAAFTPPTRLDVPCIFSRTGRPIISVTMGTQGAGQIQDFNFTFTTSLGYTAVANKGCSACTDTPLYDIGLSPQATSLSGTPVVSLGAGNFTGGLIKENCTLQTKQGSPWAYTNQTILLMDTQSTVSPFEDGVSGLLGLGTFTQSSSTAGFNPNFDDTLFGQYYIRNPEAQNFTFGLALKPSLVIPGDSDSLTISQGAQSLADGDAGTVHWLQPDHDSYQQDKVQWRTVTSGVTTGYLAGNAQPDLTVTLDGWSAKIGTNNVGNGAPLLVNVDPYYSGIYMPGSQARLIHDAIQGSQQVQKSTIPGQTSSWTVPCNTAFSFTVVVGDQQFTVDQSLLVVKQGDGTCISLIEGFTSTSVTQYIFGQTWISQLYVIFNIPKNGNAQLAFAPRTASTKSRDIGAIVGGTVGGVAAVVAIGLVLFYFLRQRQDKRFFRRAEEFEQEHKVASSVDPYVYNQGGAPQSPFTPAVYTSPPTSPHTAGFITPPVSPQHPLLEQEALTQPPPSYEQSAAGSASGTQYGANQYPREKQQLRADTMYSVTDDGRNSALVSPNYQSSFPGPSRAA